MFFVTFFDHGFLVFWPCCFSGIILMLKQHYVQNKAPKVNKVICFKRSDGLYQRQLCFEWDCNFILTDHKSDGHRKIKNWKKQSNNTLPLLVKNNKRTAQRNWTNSQNAWWLSTPTLNHWAANGRTNDKIAISYESIQTFTCGTNWSNWLNFVIFQI